MAGGMELAIERDGVGGGFNDDDDEEERGFGVGGAVVLLVRVGWGWPKIVKMVAMLVSRGGRSEVEGWSWWCRAAAGRRWARSRRGVGLGPVKLLWAENLAGDAGGGWWGNWPRR
ncbi:putative formin-like protein 6 isoform X2 [Iris pallida]|uniref:Formin-like protein 6 isoform X2 n=1 Tax=Iris pallida TaxID=29817 RepID=A0AAX6GGF3_IRIPA|nr:putative formin-like protein 6 isoform X2 [Iris pallida]